MQYSLFLLFFFFNDTATTEIYTLSLHDALPILSQISWSTILLIAGVLTFVFVLQEAGTIDFLGEKVTGLGVPLLIRSEEHTSELQSRQYLVCRLLLEKKTKQLSMQANISTMKSL